jgi:hypothetical protein
MRTAASPQTFQQKLVILGFDGMDPAASVRRSAWTTASCPT